jgi:hypothetical protein
MAKLQNMHCLETNFIEGTFYLDENVCILLHSTLISILTSSCLSQTGAVLVQSGFYDQEKLIDLPNPVGGAVHDISDALSILQDTHEVPNPCYIYLLEHY